MTHKECIYGMQRIIDATQSIIEALQKLFPAPFHGAVEAFKELGRLALSPRVYRKAARWNEKNRRRRLKGLPEQPCPYQNCLPQIASAKAKMIKGGEAG